MATALNCVIIGLWVNSNEQLQYMIYIEWIEWYIYIYYILVHFRDVLTLYSISLYCCRIVRSPWARWTEASKYTSTGDYSVFAWWCLSAETGTFTLKPRNQDQSLPGRLWARSRNMRASGRVIFWLLSVLCSLSRSRTATLSSIGGKRQLVRYMIQT